MDISGTEQELNTAVARALLLRKTELELTYEQLSAMSRVTVRTLKRLLKGQSEIGMSEFGRVARAMGREPDEILATIRQRTENNSK